MASGRWNQQDGGTNEQSRDAMAARGYYQARIAVEDSIGRILSGANAGTIASRDHRTWYDQERPPLFAETLRAAKRVLDPGSVLNPGVLIDP